MALGSKWNKAFSPLRKFLIPANTPRPSAIYEWLRVLGAQTPATASFPESWAGELEMSALTDWMESGVCILLGLQFA